MNTTQRFRGARLRGWATTMLVLSIVGPVAAQPLTVDPYADLIDLYHLAQPLNGSLGQTGSWDRTGGNGDASFWYYARPGHKRAVIADLSGPGCVARIWTTAYERTTARIEIFIDGETTPTVSAYMRDFFGSGGLPPFVQPLSSPSTGSWVSYVPIPFQRSCRIETVDARTDNGVIYYNVTYRQYPAGTNVAEPFEMPPTPNQQAALNTFSQQWAQRGQDPKPSVAGEQVIANAHFVVRGQTATLASIPGAGMITGIRLSLDANNAAWLEETTIRARWDGSPTYAIDAKAGSFFCSTYDMDAAESVPMGTKDNQAYCYLPMPFTNGAVIEFENTAPYDFYINQAYVSYIPMSPENVSRMRFHADYKEEFISGGTPSYRIMSTSGRGHYVGCTMAIRSASGNWGILEGDEQIYVNGESTPSILGTGTEDYFNGGFYFLDGTVFLPFHGIPTLDNSMLTLSTYRLQVPDPVVFRNGCIVDIEHGGQNEVSGWYESTAYYYRDDSPGTTPAEPVNPVLAAEPVINSDFENGFGGYNGGEALNWMGYQSRDFYGTTAPTFAEATDQTWSGSRSQKITFPWSGPSGYQHAGVAQQVRVSKGTTYEVTARLRLNLSGNLTLGQVVPRLGLNPSGSTYYEDPDVVWFDAPTTQNTWHTVTGSITAETDYLTVFAGGLHKAPTVGGNATIWIDDVRFTNQPTIVPGDLDRDGDVDQTDFGLLQACFSGYGVPQGDPECQPALLNNDSSVDISDLQILWDCMSGADVEADPACVQ